MTNFERHGVDFADAVAFEWDLALTAEENAVPDFGCGERQPVKSKGDFRQNVLRTA
ncbi:MAG TPA: hypothetical protein VK943_13555 [Arenibaculum sp.]|nr:hypothetical protein [Arenibaculum sp.]